MRPRVTDVNEPTVGSPILRLVPPPGPEPAPGTLTPAGPTRPKPPLRALDPPAEAPALPPLAPRRARPGPPLAPRRARPGTPLRYRALDRALEHQVLPDSLLRAASRYGAGARERRESRGGIVAQEERLRALLRRISSGPLAERTARAGRPGYELPPEVLGLILGPRHKHSSCLWEPATQTLAQAEDAMLGLSCLRAQVRDGMRILDLGCGWGSLTLWLAEHYPASHITGVAGSSRQRAWIESERDRRGLPNVEVITAQVSDFAPRGRFDRVMSVETFEHVRNWRELLRRISTWLEDDGKAFVHVFSHRTLPYVSQGTWAAERFFPGGLVPSHDLITRFQEHLELTDRWVESGTHYAKTLRAWRAQLDAHTGEALELLIAGGRTPGQARTVLAGWRLFLLSTEEMWSYGGGNRWLISHYRLVPRAG